MNKFESSIMDMHFRTTTSVSTQQSKSSKHQNFNAANTTMQGVSNQAMNLLQANGGLTNYKASAQKYVSKPGFANIPSSNQKNLQNSGKKDLF
mmetsp:Transcript_7478/g.6773  ORF Transcript_7478/g.6773 Transcript_7478/m.6773 type:complete len:93 (-) Transcript_7478:41-319(-)